MSDPSKPRRSFSNPQVEAAAFGHTNPVIPADLLRVAQNLQSSREERERHFDRAMFGEAAWDIMLALYIAHGRGYRLKVTDACFEARVPGTTALRWLSYLMETGFIAKSKSPHDARLLFVDITPSAVARMNDYLRDAQGILSRV